jgi:threonine/homoserine/homoserine lactone efflux protein
MSKGKFSNRVSGDEVLSNIIILVLGILIFSVGVFMFYTELAGTRWMRIVEGPVPKAGGIIFILLGGYLIISSIKKFSSVR